MSKLPFELAAYVAFIVLAAAAMVVYVGATHLVAPGPRDLYYMAVLATMIAVAGRYPLHLTAKRKVIVETAPLLAAVLLLQPLLAVTTCLFGKSLAQAATEGPAFQKAFNAATTALTTGLASMFHAGSEHGSLAFTFLGDAGPLLATGLIMSGTDFLIIEGIVSLQLKQRPFYRWWSLHGQEFQHEGTLLLLGLFASVIAQNHPWTLLLIAPPTAIVYRSLRDGLQLRVQTRETVEALADVVDMRDHYTFEHSKRVALLARDLAQAMNLDDEEAEAIYTAARVHDVGKIGIKGQILLKEGKLTEEEWMEMKSHPEVGAKLVSKLPEFSKGRELILSHHERYDGTGYPRALEGTRIPLGARIIAVVDAYDAMTSNRAYRSALEQRKVLEQLRGNRGSQFDPEVVDAFLGIICEKEPEGDFTPLRSGLRPESRLALSASPR